MPKTKSVTGQKIFDAAMNDIFPFDPATQGTHPNTVAGKLIGYTVALDAVGFDYRPTTSADTAPDTESAEDEQ